MANRNFPCNKQYNFHVMPVLVDMQIAIGASGAPTLSEAPGVQSITRKAAGIYQIQLKDNYADLLGMRANMIEAVSGAAADPNGVTVGSVVEITTVGNTSWSSAGLPSSITAAVGARFVLTAQPSAGTGRVKVVAASNIDKIELACDLQNSNNPTQGNAIAGTNGAIIIIKCLQAQIGATTAQGDPLQYTAADPTEGMTLQISLDLNNSSVQ